MLQHIYQLVKYYYFKRALILHSLIHSLFLHLNISYRKCPCLALTVSSQRRVNAGERSGCTNYHSGVGEKKHALVCISSLNQSQLSWVALSPACSNGDPAKKCWGNLFCTQRVWIKWINPRKK